MGNAGSSEEAGRSAAAGAPPSAKSAFTTPNSSPGQKAGGRRANRSTTADEGLMTTPGRDEGETNQSFMGRTSPIVATGNVGLAANMAFATPTRRPHGDNPARMIKSAPHRRQKQTPSPGSGRRGQTVYGTSRKYTPSPSKRLYKKQVAKESKSLQERYRKKLEKEARERALSVKRREKRDRLLAEGQKMWDSKVDFLGWEKVCTTKGSSDAEKHLEKIRPTLEWLVLKYGVPTKLRQKVWKLTLGNRLNITEELFQVFLQRAEDVASEKAAINEALDQAAMLEIEEKAREMQGVEAVASGNSGGEEADQNVAVKVPVVVETAPAGPPAVEYPHAPQHMGEGTITASPIIKPAPAPSLVPLTLASLSEQAGESPPPAAAEGRKRAASPASSVSSSSLTPDGRATLIARRNSIFGRETSVFAIDVDLTRTFPQLAFFSRGGTYHRPLQQVLGAYCFYRPDCGYVQGMSFLAAMLLLQMENPYDTFVAMASIMGRDDGALLQFYQMDLDRHEVRYAEFDNEFKAKMPDVYEHLNDKLGITSKSYLLPWWMTVFSKYLSLELSTRVWDMYMLVGDPYLVNVSLGILHACRQDILRGEFSTCMNILQRRFPENIDADGLFASITAMGVLR